MISVVIPIYKSRITLVKLVEEIKNELNAIGEHYEIILVDDGCPENSWFEIVGLAQHDKAIKAILLSRNFGQHPAIFAGLEKAAGEWVVVMDADFQDNPKYISALYEKALNGFEIVFAKRMARKDARLKQLTSKLFYWLLSFFTQNKFDSSIGNFGIYHKKVIQSVLLMQEPFKIFTLMVRWVGYRTTSIEVDHGERRSGKSAYTFKKLVALGGNVLLFYSVRPIQFTVWLGFMISFSSFVMIIYHFYKYITHQIEVLGYTSIVLSILFFGGLIIAVLGLIGLYVGKILQTTLNRPVYLISEVLNIEKPNS
ncbi:MAG: glycosyltransferase family 2 protein [Chryseotalea sp.]